MKYLANVSLPIMLAACSASSPSTPDSSQPVADAAVRDAPDDPQPTCARYPIPWPADPASQATAETELATVAPGARLFWNDNTSTLRSIVSLDSALPCPDGTDANTVALGFFGVHPALFQLDPAEWEFAPMACEAVRPSGFSTSLSRSSLAGRTEQNDVIGIEYARIDGMLHVTNVSAGYVAHAPDAIAAQMASCTAIDQTAAKAIALGSRFVAETFELCHPTGELSYVPHANDAFVLDPASAASWTWEERYLGTRLTGAIRLRITVDPSNYTDALLSSAARCTVPGSETEITVGFDVFLDVQTGEIVAVKPGLDCLVC